MDRLDNTPIYIYRYKYSILASPENEWAVNIAATSYDEAENHLFSRVGQYHITERGCVGKIDSITARAANQIYSNRKISMEKQNNV